MEKFDYVIVGAGPAGCVLANRLSADPKTRVLLLEAGPVDRHPFIHMPKGIGKILAVPAYTWAFNVRRRAGDNQPTSVWMRGKTLGGSSAVNGLMYVRGQPADYDALAAVTSPDWDWAHIGQAFKAIEGHELAPAETRGDKGPLRVTLPKDPDVLQKAALDAAQALGIPVQEDVNTPDNGEKIGYGVRTIHGGRRQSGAVAFLRPVRRRTNLVVRTHVLVDRVVFDGDKAVAVEGRWRGRPQRFEGETIILSAGTLASPAILQRSGVGPRALLTSLGIDCVADRPAVGQNLREHSALNAQWRVKNAPSNNPRYRGVGLMWSVLRYYLTRTGVMSNATFEITGFFKTRPDVERANAQLLFAIHSFDRDKALRTVENKPGVNIGMYPLRPRSKGEVVIQSKDPAVLPKVVMDFFADPEDRREQLELFRFIRKWVRTAPLADFIAEETLPGPDCQSDDDIVEAIVKYGTPGYHASGTCRMGADADSVVDPGTRVRGVRNLHVVDLSIAPFVVAGNTYGPVAAMAWRAADLILADRA